MRRRGRHSGRTDTAKIRVIEGEAVDLCARCRMGIWAIRLPPVRYDGQLYHVRCARSEHLDRTQPPVMMAS